MSSGTLQTSRRGILAGGAATAALALAGSPLQAASALFGRVIEEKTIDGARGLAGVQVSNGREIAVTDRSGHWHLPARPGEHVFVIKPDDYAWPVAVDSPLTCAHTITGSHHPTSYDFVLRRKPEPRKFDVALLADTQPQSELEVGYLRDSVLPAVIESGAAFAINHGDVVFDRPDLYPRYFDLIASTGMPWLHCPGNHDMDHGPPHASFETWKRTFGPCHTAFHFGGATFILLNNVERLPASQLTPGGYNYRGAFGRDQLTFVQAVLAALPPERLVVISMHIPLVSADGSNEPASVTADRVALLSLLSGRPNTLSLAGHTHTTEHHDLGAMDGFTGPGRHHHHVLTAACGSWWSGPYDSSLQPVALSSDGTPRGLHVLEIDRHTYKTRYVAVANSGHPQMRLTLDGCELDGGNRSSETRVRRGGALASDECSRTVLAINVFDGGPRTRVTCSLRRAGDYLVDRLQPRRQLVHDTTAIETFLRHRDVVKPWVEVGACSHLWHAPLPALGAGSYVASVEAVDPYGRKHTSSLIFEVVA
jgi:hypothetical protein